MQSNMPATRTKAMSTPLHAAGPKRTLIWHHNPFDIDDPSLYAIEHAVEAINFIVTDFPGGELEPSVVLAPDGQVFKIDLTAVAVKADPDLTREVIEAARVKELHTAK